MRIALLVKHQMKARVRVLNAQLDLLAIQKIRKENLHVQPAYIHLMENLLAKLALQDFSAQIQLV